MIRVANNQDVESIFQLQQQAFTHEKWTKDVIAADLVDDQKVYFVYEKQGKIVGFVSFLLAVETADILQIVVAPMCQHQGIGQSLLKYGFAYLKDQKIQKVFLEVRQHNSAREFYQKVGFVYLNTRKNYYGTEDALVYQYVLN